MDIRIGDETSFQTITKLLQDAAHKLHVDKVYKHYQYAAKIDAIFEGHPYGWSKAAYHAEVDRRVSASRSNTPLRSASDDKKA